MFRSWGKLLKPLIEALENQLSLGLQPLERNWQQGHSNWLQEEFGKAPLLEAGNPGWTCPNSSIKCSSVSFQSQSTLPTSTMVLRKFKNLLIPSITEVALEVSLRFLTLTLLPLPKSRFLKARKCMVVSTKSCSIGLKQTNAWWSLQSFCQMMTWRRKEATRIQCFIFCRV